MDKKSYSGAPRAHSPARDSHDTHCSMTCVPADVAQGKEMRCGLEGKDRRKHLS